MVGEEEEGEEEGEKKSKTDKTYDRFLARRTLYTLQGEQQDNDTGHTTGSIPMTQQDQLRERAGTTSPENVCRKWRAFPYYLCPRFQSESWWLSFHMERSFHLSTN